MTLFPLVGNRKVLKILERCKRDHPGYWSKDLVERRRIYSAVSRMLTRERKRRFELYGRDFT